MKLRNLHRIFVHCLNARIDAPTTEKISFNKFLITLLFFVGISRDLLILKNYIENFSFKYFKKHLNLNKKIVYSLFLLQFSQKCFIKIAKCLHLNFPVSFQCGSFSLINFSFAIVGERIVNCE